MNEYIKDFDKWNEIKKVTDSNIRPSELFFHEQEIWWCSLGINIGSEIDGKNDFFERPVLIIRRINKDLLLIVPLTSKIKTNHYRIDIVCSGIKSQIVLDNSRTISSKRLIRRIGLAKNSIFQKTIINLIKLILEGETPP